jgi:hypothetical protein
MGSVRLSGRNVSAAIGVSETSYRREWKERYYRCYSFVQDIDCEVARAVAKNGK